MYSMQNNGQFCSIPKAHWMHGNKCIAGAYGKTTKRDTLLSILKLLKKKAIGFPFLAQEKEIDSGIVA